MLKTKFTDMFAVQTPIMQGGMQWIGDGAFAAAISNAGALGTITALTFPSPAALAEEIARCRELTDRPFAVNITTLPSINPPPYDEYRNVIIKSGVTIVETSGSDPRKFVPLFHDAGIKVIHKVTSVQHAVVAQESGADAIAVVGFEAAGHPGELDLPLLVLVSTVLRSVDIPVLAAGGLADGHGLAASLALGASGILMGTRFMATAEAPIHDDVKLAIVNSNALSTSLIFRELKNTARVAKNQISENVAAILRDGGDFSSVHELVAGSRGRKVYETGDTEAGIWWAGLAQGLIDDVPTCSALIQRIVSEAEGLISTRLPSYVV
ncbi:MAG: nitronate monooxygenase [Candidatus Nanopelagicales bacterium]|jgi:NAD(P)H-dependent flavin oxidoreductase YrpB (nitropropane dioxygenase family)